MIITKGQTSDRLAEGDDQPSNSRVGALICGEKIGVLDAHEAVDAIF